MEKELICYLSSFLSESRLGVLKKNLSLRTRYITIVLEDIFQGQNASAVLRTCDCFGIQDIHVIENNNKFNEYTNVTRGSSKWMTINHYNQTNDNTIEAINRLKNEGYKIVATTPHQNDILLEDFDLTMGKSAFIFGNEKKGISDIVRQEADYFMKIPMYGFTESLNLSVSVAITLHYLSNKIRTLPIDWKLTPEEQQEILFDWLKKCVKSSDLILNNYMASKEC